VRNRFLPTLWILLLLLAAGASPAATPTGLRCEYRVNPLGIDAAQPMLSWRLPADETNVWQSACRVLAASSRELLAADQGDLWDSGRKPCEEESGFAYRGKALTSGQICFWKVKVYSPTGKESDWSEPAFWTMGLLTPADWTAEWIGFDAPRQAYEEQHGSYVKPPRILLREVDPKDEITEIDGKPLTVPPVATNRWDPPPLPLFLPPARRVRAEFPIAKPIRRAVLYATALGLYEIRLNGQAICEDFFTPGWSDYQQRVYYNTYDVTALLREGNNAFGAQLADGWFSGYVGQHWQRDHYGTKLRLRAQLMIEYADGSRETFGTSSAWKAQTGPLVEADFLMGETYDARKETEGWDEPGFDDSAWYPVDLHTTNQAVLCSYPTTPVRMVQKLAPRSINEPVAGTYVFDFGSNFAGFVRLMVQAEKGTVITLKYGERLNPDGTVYTENLRSARAIDTYICNGDELEVWQPRFTYHGFQYVSLTGLPSAPEPETLTGIELSSIPESVGRFECSHPLLNQLYQNILQSQRANFLEVPTDCPQRDERLGWTGDAQVFIRTAILNADTQSFFRKWFTDLRDAQFEGGDMPKVAPSRPSSKSGGPAWADANIICPWALYEMYGDVDALERHYESMASFMEFRLRETKNNHGFGDWLNLDAETPRNLIFDAYTAGDLRIMEQAARLLKRNADAARYKNLLSKYIRDFQSLYVDRDGRVQGNTQTAYLLALGFDLLDNKTRSKAEKHLINRIAERDGHLSTGFLGTRDLLPVLSQIDRNDVAFRLLFNETYPSWLFPVKNGATSIWENWNGWTPEDGFLDPGGNSFSHYAYGAVGQWMIEQIGGIQRTAPGFREILFRPAFPPELEWANTAYDSPRGLIRSEWRRNGKQVTLLVEVPPNTSAVVQLPGQPRKKVSSGIHTFEGTLP
jgi:alpha-L-rhamnosidase